MPSDQKIRAALFYLGLAVFLIGLPFILSFALGYKFNPRAFKFSKTGLIDIKTQPQGARIYLDGKLLEKKTPASLDELLPGKYKLKAELESFYPWTGDVDVQEGKVSRLDKIILFPLRPDVKKLNKTKVSFFWVDNVRSRIYYINQEENSLYRSDLEGEHYQIVGSLPDVISAEKKHKLSPDKEKLLIFSSRRIVVAFLELAEGHSILESSVVLDFPGPKINDVFWHSDSFHLILATDADIRVIEARPFSRAVVLAELNKKDASVFYDPDADTLYFMDAQRGPDGKVYDNVYKLDLASRLNPFGGLIRPKAQWKNGE